MRYIDTQHEISFRKAVKDSSECGTISAWPLYASWDVFFRLICLTASLANSNCWCESYKGFRGIAFIHCSLVLFHVAGSGAATLFVNQLQLFWLGGLDDWLRLNYSTAIKWIPRAFRITCWRHCIFQFPLQTIHWNIPRKCLCTHGFVKNGPADRAAIIDLFESSIKYSK